MADLYNQDIENIIKASRYCGKIETNSLSGEEFDDLKKHMDIYKHSLEKLRGISTAVSVLAGLEEHIKKSG